VVLVQFHTIEENVMFPLRMFTNNKKKAGNDSPVNEVLEQATRDETRSILQEISADAEAFLLA
jgi:ABC-type lipoprotein export system ATPase subunit